jgi:hypothetical protein
MPPKKKGGGKKKAGKKAGAKGKGPTIIDGVPVTEMTKEQLEGHVRRLQEEVILQTSLISYLIIIKYRFSSNLGVSKKRTERATNNILLSAPLSQDLIN